MKKRGRKILHIVFVVLLVVLLMVGAFAIYENYQIGKIPGLSFKDCLNYTLQGNDNAFITVGIIKDGKATYTVYGKDGAEMPQTEHTYEIGSLTKTFTAALIEKAIIQISAMGRLDLFLKWFMARIIQPLLTNLLRMNSDLKTRTYPINKVI